MERVVSEGKRETEGEWKKGGGSDRWEKGERRGMQVREGRVGGRDRWE